MEPGQFQGSIAVTLRSAMKKAAVVCPAACRAQNHLELKRNPAPVLSAYPSSAGGRKSKSLFHVRNRKSVAKVTQTGRRSLRRPMSRLGGCGSWLAGYQVKVFGLELV